MFLHAPRFEEEEEARQRQRREREEQGEAAAADNSRPEADDEAPAGPRRIEPGDMVIVYENINSAKFIYVERGGVFKNRYGTFRHDVRR